MKAARLFAFSPHHPTTTCPKKKEKRVALHTSFDILCGCWMGKPTAETRKRGSARLLVAFMCLPTLTF